MNRKLENAMEAREHLVAYLLGELPEEEQARVEQDFLSNDDTYEQLLVIEDELTYDYLEGRLSPPRRSLFESAIAATPRGRKNMEFAKALLDALRATPIHKAWTARYWTVAIAASLALMVLPAWLAIRIASMTSELSKL